jgi:hypothetical protein
MVEFTTFKRKYTKNCIDHHFEVYYKFLILCLELEILNNIKIISLCYKWG